MGNNGSSEISNKGLALLFSHEHYDNDPSKEFERPGCEADDKSLKKSLSSVGFEVIIFKDLSRAEVKETIAEYSCVKDLSSYDCLLLIVMTHGGKDGQLLARDCQMYNIRDVIEPFQTTQTLLGKTKFCIFQACRGTDAEQLSSVCKKYKLSEKLSLPKLPRNPHFLFGFSSPETYRSYRWPEHGSLYIQAMCRVIDTMQGRTNILSLLTDMTRITIDSGENNEFQTPFFSSFLCKNLFLTKRSIGQALPPTDDTQDSNLRKMGNGSTNHSADIMRKDLYYPWSRAGHAIILHPFQHKKIAHDLERILTGIDYTNKNKCYMYNKHDCLEEYLQKEAKTIPDNAGCLLVVFFAKLFVKSDVRSQGVEWSFGLSMDGKEYSASSVVKHFLPDQCPQLIKQPKVFIFIDLQDGSFKMLQSDDMSKVVPEDVTDITALADCVVAFGFGRKYYTFLEESIKNGEDVLESLTSANEAALENAQRSRNNPKDCLSHFESSLTLKLAFCKPPSQENGIASSSLNSNMIQSGPMETEGAPTPGPSSSYNRPNFGNLRDKHGREQVSSSKKKGSAQNSRFDSANKSMIVKLEDLNIDEAYVINTLEWVKNKKLKYATSPKESLRGTIVKDNEDKYVYFPASFTRAKYNKTFANKVTNHENHYVMIYKGSKKHPYHGHYIPEVEFIKTN